MVTRKVTYVQGWAIALFEKERIPLFLLLKRAKKEQKIDLLFLRSFSKERNRESLFVALFENSERAKSERAKERLPNPGNL